MCRVVNTPFFAIQMDVFEVEAVDLQQLHTVIVGHDGMGAGNGWYLNKIIIREHPDDAKKYVFKCDRWLDEGEDDGRIERQLKVKEGQAIQIACPCETQPAYTTGEGGGIFNVVCGKEKLVLKWL